MPLTRFAGRHRWRWTCATLVVPYAAVLHHAVFFPRTCVWNPFEGADRFSTNPGRLLREDPSLPWAVAAAVLTYRAGKNRRPVRRLVGPLFASTVPLSVWLWDLPFSGRVLCRTVHDGNLKVGRVKVRSAHFYPLAAGAYVALLAAGAWRGRHR